MKVAFITDTHYGVRNDKQVIADHQNKFFYDIFLKELLDRKITRVIHLGDLYDRRKYINFLTAKNVRDNFIYPLVNNGIEVDLIVGNHDTYFKNTNSVNSVDILLGDSVHSNNFRVYHDGPVEIDFDGTSILLCPWICDDNREKSIAALQNTTANYVCGHFEIQGFEMHRGTVCGHGESIELFGKFDHVFSGHFHHKSSNKNITYLGAPYEMTWGDYNDPKGFHIFDTLTGELEFVQNPYSIFNMITYDDNDITIEDITDLDVSLLKNTYVKVVVKNKNNPYLLDMLLSKIEAVGPEDLKTIYDTTLLNYNEEEIIDEAEDTVTILKKYVDNMDINVDKDEVSKLLSELHQEALSI